jgi:hypothetical protein
MVGQVTNLQTVATQVLSGALDVNNAHLRVNLFYHNWSITGYYQNAGFLQDLQLYCVNIGVDPSMWNGLL